MPWLFRTYFCGSETIVLKTFLVIFLRFSDDKSPKLYSNSNFVLIFFSFPCRLLYEQSGDAGHCTIDKYALDHEGTIQYDQTIPRLEQFTLCAWMRFINHSGDHSVFTYSGKRHHCPHIYYFHLHSLFIGQTSNHEYKICIRIHNELSLRVDVVTDRMSRKFPALSMAVQTFLSHPKLETLCIYALWNEILGIVYYCLIIMHRHRNIGLLSIRLLRSFWCTNIYYWPVCTVCVYERAKESASAHTLDGTK